MYRRALRLQALLVQRIIKVMLYSLRRSFCGLDYAPIHVSTYVYFPFLRYRLSFWRHRPIETFMFFAFFDRNEDDIANNTSILYVHFYISLLPPIAYFHFDLSAF